MNKSSRIIIRIDPAQRDQFEAAARAADKSVSEWLRDLGAAAVAPPEDDYPPTVLSVQDANRASKRALEIVNSIPGLHLGIGELNKQSGRAISNRKIPVQPGPEDDSNKTSQIPENW